MRNSPFIPFGNHRNSAGEIRPNYPATFVFGALLGAGAALITMAATGGFKSALQKEEDAYAFHNGLHQVAAVLSLGLIVASCFLVVFVPSVCIFNRMDTQGSADSDSTDEEVAVPRTAGVDPEETLLLRDKSKSSWGLKLAPWGLALLNLGFSVGTPALGIAESGDANKNWEGLTNSPTVHWLAVVVFSLVVTASAGAVSVGLHACCGALFCKASSASTDRVEMAEPEKYSATQVAF